MRFKLPVTVLAAASTMLLASAGTQAADIGRQCFSGEYRSGLVNQAPSDIELEVTRRYDRAVELSQTHSVIYSDRNLWNWANETKVSCGKAIGYLASGEVNAEQITQCDCFHGIMFYLAN